MIHNQNLVLLTTSIPGNEVSEKRISNLLQQMSPYNIPIIFTDYVKKSGKTSSEISCEMVLESLAMFQKINVPYAIVCDNDFCPTADFLSELNKTVELLPADWRSLHLCPGFLWGRWYRNHCPEKVKSAGAPATFNPEFPMDSVDYHESGRFYTNCNPTLFFNRRYWLGGPVAVLINKSHLESFTSDFLQQYIMNSTENNDVIFTRMLTENDFVCRDPPLGCEDEQGGTTMTTTKKCAIPKRIVQTFKTKTFSPQFQAIVDQWKTKNPSFEYVLYDDTNCYEFLQKNFDARVLRAYKRIGPGAFKADLWRYCYLFIHGGVYVDIDTVCLGAIEDFFTPGTEFIAPIDLNTGGEYGYHNLFNAFIATVPQSPIMQEAIEQIVRNVETNTIPPSKLDFSGPGVLGRAVNRFLKRPETESFLGCEGQHKGLHLLKFEASTELVKDVRGNVLFQNKNGNRELQFLYHMETEKAKTVCWVNTPTLLTEIYKPHQ